MKSTRSAKLLGLTLAAGLAVAACGSDSDSDSSSSDTSSSDTTATTEAMTETTDATTETTDAMAEGVLARRRLSGHGRHPARLDARSRTRIRVPDGR